MLRVSNASAILTNQGARFGIGLIRTRLRAELRREGQGTRSHKRLPEAGEHGEVGMNPYPVDATSSKRGKTVLVLEASEFALDGGSATVEALPLVGA